VQDLYKTLAGKTIINGANLEVKQGEIMALVGPSGSGKTTLVRCLNRLLEPDKGSIQFNNTDISTIAPQELRRSMVLVHQESVMLPGTVWDNITYGPSLMGEVNAAHIKQSMIDAGIPSDFEQKQAEKLSGGEKKRVALARALALEPQVLLLDEPTSGVDPKNIQTMEKTIVSFSKERKLTVVWITHDVPQAQRVSHRIANLKEGRVTQVSPTKEFQWEGAY